MDRRGGWAAAAAILLIGLVVACGAYFARGARDLARTPTLAPATPSPTGAPAVSASTDTPGTTAAPPAAAPSSTLWPTRPPAATPSPVAAATIPSPTAPAASTARPVDPHELPTPPLLLKGDGPEVYLLVEGQRRHIADMDTFAHLGYREEDILVFPSLLPAYGDGPPLTRLLQGADGQLYWMVDGVRHPIPDRDARATGQGISPVPEALLLSFPLGAALSSASSGPQPVAPTPVQERIVSTYHPLDGGPRLTELYTVRADGALPRRLTASDGNAYSLSPAWSPDGRLVAYSHCPDGSSGSCVIAIIPSGGGAARTLTDGMSEEPAWSPDGRRIAFWSTSTDSIRVMDADGANVRELGAGRRPAWTPDGRIAFWAGEQDPYVLSVVDVASGVKEPVDSQLPVYDQRYHPWRATVWAAAGDPSAPAGP